MAVNWEKIKREYVTDPTTSYRTLARKYKVAARTVMAKGSVDKWVEARRQYIGKTSTAILEAKEKADIDNATSIQRVASELIKKIGEALSTIEPEDITKLNTCAGALNKLSNVKDSDDLEEQRARIARLRKEIEDDAPAKVEVILSNAGPDDWNT